MADTGIFATTLEVQYKAGAKASPTSKAEAYVNSFMTQVESFINAASGYNWSDDYSGLNVDKKGLLKEAASNLAAIYVINYDPSTFTQRSEAETIMNVLYQRAMDCISLLKEQAATDFVKLA